MKTLLHFFLTAIIMANALTLVNVQGLELLQESLEKSVKQKKSDWMLGHKEFKPKDFVNFQWGYKDKSITVYIAETASSRDAAQRFVAYQLAFSGPVKRTVLTGYGDEANLYKAGGRSRKVALISRQGKYFIRIAADHQSDAEFIVKEICELIKTVG